MKLVTLQHENNLIEVRNNFLTGVETVYFNGTRVCREFNWFTGAHRFRVRNDDTGRVDLYEVNFHTSFRKWYGVAVDIVKNGDYIHNESGHGSKTITTVVIRSNEQNTPLRADYDRQCWYGEARKAERAVYLEGDLV
ncbi:hypothetical protein [Neolewinella antarctica]|uniref:Uncharacterized protein n=1 Tax=Neolewinella antarctica TaxID=442734 RepID=A0ABX0X5Q7_9BACT|nr:hypothetical protein [Neolewinella antarctica]NJC24535.1 hypothetical protein [Neolewinella antarctica]